MAKIKPNPDDIPFGNETIDEEKENKGTKPIFTGGDYGPSTAEPPPIVIADNKEEKPKTKKRKIIKAHKSKR